MMKTEMSWKSQACFFLLYLLLQFPTDSLGISKGNAQIQQNNLKRSQFPDEFLFGASTSAYQIEGAYLEDGKGINNWDVFCTINGKIQNGDNGNVADDHYHRYLEDIDLMHDLGLDAYRFSISWTRILPKGRFGGVNQAGIEFYNKVIDNLLSKGIKPFVTIHHHDHPQELEDRYGGWLSSEMQEDFVYFAEICFESFGDRVKYWITINEPNLFADMAYERGWYPPAHCSPPFGNCSVGNSDVEPLIAMHNMLLAHGKAAKAYREQFQAKQGGLIGITAHMFMYEPLSNDVHDQEAANRALAFTAAWTYDPLVFGDYPPEMRLYHGSELPSFTSEESALIKDSVDFIGINHYSTLYVKDCLYSRCNCTGSSCSKAWDRAIQGFYYTTGERDGVLIGEPTGNPRVFVVPRGIEEIVDYIKERYHNKPMFILENGYSSPNKTASALFIENDAKRIEYHKAYLPFLARAISNGADVRGYFIWSFMDAFEWTDGYETKFGLYYVQPLTLHRFPKLSATWYRDFLSNNVQTTNSTALHSVE
ncbi:beta-glucosidase 18-like isoform X1 [Ipomoea triloba]|uniref:beta-glucosidase 18-like isoform X1 n=2 Tax=Ipomoea triloba TaxID=35885 RepID=UPI00125DF339|nr:beta-glucosidase 18-like isoform X1 [Ipomoea triloba]